MDQAPSSLPFSPGEDKLSVTALTLAALVHVLLIGALFFGVQWKRQPPAGVAVEVWRAGPAALPPRAEPLPTQTPPPPLPPPKPEPRPEPKVEPPPPVKPDIAVKDEKPPKKEPPKKEEVKKEEPKKPEAKKEAPKKPPEPERRPNFDDEIQRELRQTQQQRAEQARREARAATDARIRAQLEGDASAASLRGMASYIDKVRGKIRGNIVLPPGLQGNPEAVFRVTQLPSGEIVGEPRLMRSSGHPAYDEAIIRAIKKSSPLPKPDDSRLFQRELELRFRPREE